MDLLLLEDFFSGIGYNIFFDPLFYFELFLFNNEFLFDEQFENKSSTYSTILLVAHYNILAYFLCLRLLKIYCSFTYFLYGTFFYFYWNFYFNFSLIFLFVTF